MSASVASECNLVKERYDSCFLRWYSEKFLKGTATSDECEPLFKQYQQCLTRALSEKGIDKMLQEAMHSNKDYEADNSR